MHAWEGKPRTNTISDYASLGPETGATADSREDPKKAGWRLLASAIAGTLLGVPFFESGTVRMACSEIWHWMTVLRK